MAANVAGSEAGTSNNSPRITPPRANAPASPIVTPTAAIASP
jgi:hypothetical protein